MKRLLYALAALWPEKRGEGSPPVSDTRTGILQHWAAVLWMEGILGECADSRICKSANETLGAVALNERSVLDGGLNVSKPEQGKSANTQIRESAIKPMLTIVIPVFFMCLMAAKQVSAQAEPAAAASITPLQIGDTVPEELWHLPLQVVNHPEGKEMITLNDYREKLIILDFWATWCVPCINSLYKLDTLQQQFAQDLMVVPTTYEVAGRVAPFFKEKGWRLGTLVGDTVLKGYFPHRIIPHQIWVLDNEVFAVTGSASINAHNISLAIADGVRPEAKTDLSVDYFEALSTYAVEQHSQVYLQSSLTGYIPGIGDVGRKTDGDRQVFYVFNRPVMYLYERALRITKNEFLLELGSNPDPYLSPGPANDGLYCHQLIAQLHVPYPVIRDRLVDDLNLCFGLQGRFESRDSECYVIRSKDSGSVVSQRREGDRDYGFSSFVGLLNFYEEWDSKMTRFIDKSGYTGTVFANSPKQITLLKYDIPALEAFLSDYGLELSEEKMELEFFVISKVDNGKDSNIN